MPMFSKVYSYTQRKTCTELCDIQLLSLSSLFIFLIHETFGGEIKPTVKISVKQKPICQ